MNHQPRIERQVGDHTWETVTDSDAADRLLAAAETTPQLIPTADWSIVWKTMSHDEILATLSDPTRTLRYGEDVNESIRGIRDQTAHGAVDMVRCSCGHTIPRDQVMAATLGSSCPDCYDRLS
jgi:hypothetical protein